MRVLRGRAGTIAADREASGQLLESAAGGLPAVRAWRPHRQVAFGRRDVRSDGYDRARELARERGFPPVERSVGGRAVAYDGETTLAFARAEPVADFRRGTGDRYERLTGALECALSSLGVDAERGEPDDSFCPGTHSLQAPDGDGKIVGIAQRVTVDAALVSGVVVVADRAELAAVTDAVYGALGVAFDPDSLGSVAAAGGPADPGRVRAAVEDALVDDAEGVTVERVDGR